MKTRKEIKAEWHKKRRDERKQIETQLHPSPKINGYNIYHEHLRNGRIRFTAWDDNGTPLINRKEFLISRLDILDYTAPNEFYTRYKKDMEWLTID
jgi:lysozyme family protein